MYNMDIDNRPTSPVVPSQLSAHDKVSRWVRENDYSLIVDGDGSTWEVEVLSTEIPDPENPYGLLWELSINLKLDISPGELISIGALKVGKDDRIIEMLGSNSIPLAIRPKTFRGPSDEEVRRQVIDALPKVREDLESAKLLDIKGKLVGRWINDARLFGSPHF